MALAKRQLNRLRGPYHDPIKTLIRKRVEMYFKTAAEGQQLGAVSRIAPRSAARVTRYTRKTKRQYDIPAIMKDPLGCHRHASRRVALRRG